MCRRDVNARRQPLKNPIKHRQERQNSRFELLPEVRERCKKHKKIDARAYKRRFFTRTFKMAETLPKPLPQTSQISDSPRLFLVLLPKSAPRASQERPRALQERLKSAPRAPKSAQERPKSVPRAPRSAPRATKGTPRAEKYVKTRKNVQQPTKSQKNARKRTKNTQNNKKRKATTWMGFQCRLGKG